MRETSYRVPKAKGHFFDYSVITTAFLPLVQSCRIVQCVPCGTHKGVRITFFDSPASIWCWKLPRPLSFQKAVDFFSKTGEVAQ